jgi:hypothetical protein
MIIMQKIFILILGVLTLNISFAQKEKQYIEPNKKYVKARLFLKNNQIIVAKDLRLTSDSLIFFKTNYSQIEENKNINEIKFVTVKKGTKIVAGTLTGASIGLVSSNISVASHDHTGVNVAAIITGSTLGCAAIGALIGICIPTWKRLYSPEHIQITK